MISPGSPSPWPPMIDGCLWGHVYEAVKQSPAPSEAAMTMVWPTRSVRPTEPYIHIQCPVASQHLTRLAYGYSSRGHMEMDLSYVCNLLYGPSRIPFTGTKGPSDCFNPLRPRQNGRHFTDDTLNRIFLKENVRILIKISLKFAPKGPINNIPALVQIMACRRPGNKPLSESMTVSLLTHIYASLGLN